MVVLEKSRESLREIEEYLNKVKMDYRLAKVIDGYMAKAIWNIYFAIKDTIITLYLKQREGDVK